MSDQDRISPYNINTVSSRQVMRIKKNITWGIICWSNNKFSKLTFQKKKNYMADSKENYEWDLGSEMVKHEVTGSINTLPGQLNKWDMPVHCTSNTRRNVIIVSSISIVKWRLFVIASLNIQIIYPKSKF